ncbi:hypothetical protein [Methanobrevibacter sp.]|uniref:hypothetical protein n=1 Tax=Methanobrevibacter sp. TaxID=66852 RepID=UPI00388E30C3
MILSAILVTYVFTMNSVNADTFERVNLSSTCSLELPKIHFDEDNISDKSSYSGVTVGEYSKLLTSEHLSIQYTKSYISTGIT